MDMAWRTGQITENGRPALIYFEPHGRTAPLEALLAHAKVDYERIRLPRSDWPWVKGSGFFDFPNIPTWRQDGEYFHQSRAILRCLGMQHGYYPSDPFVLHACDSLVEWYADEFGKWASFLPQIFSGQWDEEKTTDFIAKLDAYAKMLESRLEGHGKQFIAGTSNPTIADFAIGSPYFVFLNNEASNLPQAVKDKLQGTIDSRPKLKRYVGETLPPVFKPWCDTRAKHPF